MIPLALKEKSKNLFLIFFSILFFVLSFWANGALRAEAAGEIYCSDSWAPGNPCISNAEDCVFCSGFVNTCTVNAPNFNQFTVLVSNLASCSSGNKYCQTASCPSDNASFSEGDLCSVRILNGASVVTSSDSHWDKSEGKCVQCLGNQQYAVCGGTAGLYLSTLGPCTGMSTYNNKLESACDAGVSPACDEKAVGAACSPPAGGTCSATGLCVASGTIVVVPSPNTITKDSAATIEFTTTVAAVATSGVSVTITGPGINANCTTGATGKCSVTVTANAVGSASVSATKAPLTAGSATITINAALACPGGFMVDFSSGSYSVGQQFLVDFGINGTGCAALYRPDNSLAWGPRVDTTGLYGNTPTGINATAGVWKVTIMNGATCDVNSTCFATTTVTAAATPTPSSTPTPTPAPKTVLGCSCGSGCPFGATITCSLADATVNTFCTANPTCTLILNTNPNCDCSSLLSATPTPGPSSSPTPTPAVACSGPGMFVSPLGPGYCTIGEILTNATNWILALVSSIIVLILIIGGLMYISSSGDEEKLRTSKNIIYYAVVGLGIILISYALITEVTNLLKGP